MSEVVLSIVAASLATLIPALYYRIFRKKKERQAVERTSEKIDHLSNILKEAATEIEKLERNIKTKSKKIAEMDELSKRLDSLISLREKQVEAIKRN